MDWILGLAVLIIKIAVLMGVVLTMAAYLILLERKLLGRFQLRLGPNRAGPFGIWQPLADGLKLLLKEDVVPSAADKILFLAAPAPALAALLIFAVVPLGPDLVLFGKRIPMVVSDLNVAVLLVLALSSIGVYAVALGGWASNSKYSLLGAVRGVAQMISYELPLALSLVPVIMLSGSLSLVDIVDAQASGPFILIQPVSFALFFVCALAESRRLPFDLPEAENELQAGYHTEYSGMRFAVYFLGEYVNMAGQGALVAVFFLGGWHGPWLPPWLWLLLKVMIMPFLLIWSRATLPRPRYDQLMHFGWKILIPIALVNIVVTGGVILVMGG